jgi:hypothetical protein
VSDRNGDDLPITLALENLALALGRAEAVPLPELIRALERAAERLRTGTVSDAQPHDLVSQSEAARIVSVSRQAVHQWVQKGTVRSYRSVHTAGRQTPMVSLSEVVAAANRATEPPFSATLRRQFLDLLDRIAPVLDPEFLETLPRAFDPGFAAGRREEAGHVLREFVIAAMGTSTMRQEFTEVGVRMLADMTPALAVSPASRFGVLADRLGLLVHTTSGASGFDSAATAVLGILGCATVGQYLDEPGAGAGALIAEAAEATWGDAWVGRLFDVAFQVEELAPAPLARYTAPLSYLGVNRFLRQAQSAGVSISYARAPGLLIPEHHYGDAVLADRLAGRQLAPSWRFSPSATPLAAHAVSVSHGNPFRIFMFERGLLDNSIHGARKYGISASDCATTLTTHVAALDGSVRPAYIEYAVDTLAQSLAQPFIEVTAVERPRDFDWWKDHIIRSSPREIMLGLRDARARQVAHALLVQTTMLPDVVEAADTDGSLRDRLRIYVKNLEFEIVNERYQDDARRGVARVIKHATESLTEAEARSRATAEIEKLLAR